MKDLAAQYLKEVLAYDSEGDNRDELFDKAEALYIYLSENHGGAHTAEYVALSQLTAPGQFKPAPNLSRETLGDLAGIYLDELEA